MTDPFASPGSASSGITWEEINGALLLIQPYALEHNIKTVHGDKDAIRADVVVLDGEKAGEEYLDTLIFPTVLIGQLRQRIDQKVLGRLGQGAQKPGQKPPWLLGDPSDADKAVGVQYITSQLATASQPPF